MTGKKVAFIICPNGLGHFRRSMEVADALASRDGSLAVEIVCERWQRERMSGWDPVARLGSRDSTRWHHGLLKPGVTWSADPSVYADGRLMAWVRKLPEADALRTTDLVVSDNLPGVLELRPDAVLMGSFLWSDVLADAYPDSPEVAAYTAWERGLLSRHRPPMLCVGAIAMPGVFGRTEAIPLPWMRAEAGRPALPAARIPAARPRVVLLAGATGSADPLAERMVDALLRNGAEAALPPGLHEAFRDRPGASRFGFTTDEFLACDLALGRPGLGAIHDCIYHGLPMALLQEARNSELSHNAERIESLGLGINLGIDPDPDVAVARSLAFARPDILAPVRGRLAATSLGGIQEAARWLEARLGRTA